MKRILTAIVLAFTCTSVFAQVLPQSASYKELKQTYDYRNYLKSDVDPYSVGWVGFVSFFTPGIGQLIMKENRGWAFLGADVAISVLANDSYNGLTSCYTLDANNELVVIDGKEAKLKQSIIGLAASGVLALANAIWSCIDAERIAKVKNMYYQDLAGQRAYSASLIPSVNLVQDGRGYVPAAGMTLSVRF